MHISLQDILAIAAAILGPIVTLIGFMWHHFNKKFEVADHKFEQMDGKIDNLKIEINSVEKRLEEKINSVEKRLEEKINSVEKRLEEKLNSVEKRLGEKIDAVRDRVSRIEGQLAPASIVSFNPPKNKAS